MSRCNPKAPATLAAAFLAQFHKARDLLHSTRTPEQQQRGVTAMTALATATGNPAAMMALGVFHDHQREWSKAMSWYEAAAALGYPPALHRLAMLRFHGKGGLQKEEEKAIEQLEALAMNGHAPSQADLGLLYKSPTSSRHCPSLAFAYLTMAAQNGCPRGMVGLGDCYKAGCGVAADPAAALAQYRAAVERGHKNAMYSLASLLLKQGQWEEGKTWTFRAAGHGHLEAMFHWGYLHHNGECGTARDMDTAVAWYTKAADAGHGKSCFQLGKLYEDGTDGLARNPPLAARWYRRGAEDLHHAPCTNSLGLCFARGFGVSRDMVQARALYAKAAHAGDVHGQVNYAACLLRGIGGPADAAAAADMLQRAADQGHVRSWVQLGNCYMQGQGVNKDASKALTLYEKAHAAGDVLGTYNMAVVLLREWPERGEEAEKLLLPNWDHGLSMLSLGRFYLQQNRLPLALKYLTRSMELREPAACYSAGQCYERQRKWREAASCYRHPAARHSTACQVALRLLQPRLQQGPQSKPQVEAKAKAGADAEVHAAAGRDSRMCVVPLGAASSPAGSNPDDHCTYPAEAPGGQGVEEQPAIQDVQDVQDEQDMQSPRESQVGTPMTPTEHRDRDAAGASRKRRRIDKAMGLGLVPRV